MFNVLVEGEFAGLNFLEFYYYCFIYYRGLLIFLIL